MSGLKESTGNLLELIDELKRAYSDPLSEDGLYSYELKEIKRDEEEVKEERLLSSNCHSCPLWRGREGSYFYFNPKKADVLSIVGYLEDANAILKSDAEEMYENQMNKVLSIPRSRRALVSLIKCPSVSFNAEYAEQCRAFLREEMQEFDAKVQIIFGLDLGRFMIKKDLPYLKLRAAERSFKINGKPTYITYSQRECLNNKSLRRQVFEDLEKIKEEAKL